MGSDDEKASAVPNEPTLADQVPDVSADIGKTTDAFLAGIYAMAVQQPDLTFTVAKTDKTPEVEPKKQKGKKKQKQAELSAKKSRKKKGKKKAERSAKKSRKRSRRVLDITMAQQNAQKRRRVTRTQSVRAPNQKVRSDKAEMDENDSEIDSADNGGGVDNTVAAGPVSERIGWWREMKKRKAAEKRYATKTNSIARRHADDVQAAFRGPGYETGTREVIDLSD